MMHPAVRTVLMVLVQGPDAFPVDVVKTLERTGRVTYEYYDPAREFPERPGLTNFRFAIDRRYVYRSRIDRSGRRRQLVIDLSVTRLDITLTHVVRLPAERSVNEPIHAELVLHEFDHVAISTDPRPRLLLEHLVRGPARVTLPLETDARAVGDRLDAGLQETLTRSTDAVVALVGFNYAELDRLTQHGTRPLPDRRAFFEGLFTPENLRAAGFPALEQVADLLDSAAYRDAARPYRE